ncbi:tubulin-specific chaperone C [Astrocystis sublimbata]|nr:tubulin-specific chaperone C [Astrocystis sublimbata]
MPTMSLPTFIPFNPSPPLPNGGLTSPQMADPKEKFFRHFQAEITLIQDEIDSLSTMSPVGGERQTGIDKVLAGISRLSNKVMDAADFIPSYDQRAYSQAIKALTEKLNATTGKLGPKSRFQFKSRSTGTAAAPSQATPDPRVHRPLGRNDRQEVEDSNKPVHDTSVAGDTATSPPAVSEQFAPKPIALSDCTGMHILLPSAASRATALGSLTNLEQCIVSMALPSTTHATCTGLALKNIKQSVIIAGHVAGAAHITGVEDSIIVVAARQVRIHDCKNVRLYLHCTSHPIIEDCSEMAFAPLPAYYAHESDTPDTNQWDQVDDFKWLKDSHSPNWSVLPENARISDGVWKKAVSETSMTCEMSLRELEITQ